MGGKHRKEGEGTHIFVKKRERVLVEPSVLVAPFMAHDRERNYAYSDLSKD
jgi:hypothetical protein